jgi:hypothetical protein
MAIWIRVVGTSSLADVTREELRAAIAERLGKIASAYGEDASGVAARISLAPPADAPSGPELGVLELRWGGEGTRPIRLERWTGPRAEEEVSELAEALEEYLENEDADEGADEIAAVLERAVDTVGIELGASHTEGVGWPLALSAALFLAERSDGVVRADGEGWLAPEDGELRHVLEAD